MPHQIVAIAGSLRAGSLNRMLAHAASELSPPAMTLAVFDELDRIPLFNEDLETSEPEGPVQSQSFGSRPAMQPVCCSRPPNTTNRSRA